MRDKFKNNISKIKKSFLFNTIHAPLIYGLLTKEKHKKGDNNEYQNETCLASFWTSLTS